MIDSCTNPVARICARMMLDLHNINSNADITIWDAMSPIPALTSKLNLCVDIQHVSNNKVQGWHNIPWIDQDCYVVIECEDRNYSHPHILFYDFMWNRSKAYYSQRNWDYRPWYLYKPDNFLLWCVMR